MNGFLTKVISIILAFILVIVGPYTMCYAMDEMEARRQILDETQLFLDQVCDKREISDTDITELNLKLAAHGMILKADVKRKVRVAMTDARGNVTACYLSVDDLTCLNEQDVIEVKVTELSASRFRLLVRLLLRIDEENYSLTRAQMVR